MKTLVRGNTVRILAKQHLVPLHNVDQQCRIRGTLQKYLIIRDEFFHRLRQHYLVSELERIVSLATLDQLRMRFKDTEYLIFNRDLFAIITATGCINYLLHCGKER